MHPDVGVGWSEVGREKIAECSVQREKKPTKGESGSEVRRNGSYLY